MLRRQHFTQLPSQSERLYRQATRLQIQSERLYQDAARLRMQAEKLPPGVEREKLVNMARQAENANEWFSSPA
jgi:hypothetical protein